VIYEFGAFQLDPAERLLRRDGEPVSLTPKGFDLLVYLVEHREKLVEKFTLMAVLWPDTIVEEANLAFQISALRKALGDSGNAEELIQTVPTKGYRFVAAVRTHPLHRHEKGESDSAQGQSAVGAAPFRARLRRLLGPAALLLVFGGLAATVLPRLSSRGLSAMPPGQPSRFDVTLPPGMDSGDFFSGEISPDGQRFVFEVTVKGQWGLAVRDMASGALALVKGAEDGFEPFWSPDSQSIGFFDRDGLKTIRATGGTARLLTRLTGPDFGDLSGTWLGNTILFTTWNASVRRIDVSGMATPIEVLSWRPGQRDWIRPKFLPDGRHFLIQEDGDPALYVASLDDPGTRKIMDDGPFNYPRAYASYVSGRLLYMRGTSLFWRPFDPERLEFSGMEAPIGDAVERGSVSASDSGAVVYRPLNPAPARLTWFTRTGQPTNTLGEPGRYVQVVLSPRGRHATVGQGTVPGTDEPRQLWDFDLATGVMSRLTTGAWDTDPSWSPDERKLAFTSFRTGRLSVFVKDLSTGKEELLVPSSEEIVLDQWTPDGQFVIFRNLGRAVYAMPLSGERTVRTLIDTPFVKDEVHVSPDGRWVAYDSNESGRWEVYVATFPSFSSRRQVSNGGGVEPQWRGDGKELFYVGRDRSMMSVRVDTRTDFAASSPTTLFSTEVIVNPYEPQYAVTADGQRFLVLERVGVGGGPAFTFLINGLNAP
jgi:eukaryotic-like serine/threonine-protein kinase